MQVSSIVERLDLLSSFDIVLARLDAFCTAVRQDAALSAWISCTEAELTENIDMRIKAIQVYRALWYEDDQQDGRETLTCPGIIGSCVNTLVAAHACNLAKDNFKAAVLALKALNRIEMKNAMIDLHRRWEPVATAMRRMGVARLNLKQVYRHIPLLEQCPLKIGFTWSKQGRVIQRTSVAAARRLLEQRIETPQVQLDMQRLEQIDNDEILARVRSVCPHLRANIVFIDQGKIGVSRRLMQAPLPILVPLLPGEPLPEFVAVAAEPPVSPRLRRADVRIEDKAFLPSIRVHRYRDFCRVIYPKNS